MIADIAAMSNSAERLSIIKDSDVMNKDTLAKVRMPNRDGFIDLYPRKSSA
jgi:hypothetical protein